MSLTPNNAKVLLLTGGNAGLGFATIQALLSSKTEYLIILCARSQEKADEAMEKLKKEHGESKTQLKGMVLDYASDESIAGLAERVEKEVGKLDILVNNGGTQFDPEFNKGNLDLTERQMWNETWSVNVSGPYLLSKALMPLLLLSKDPRIVFITSGLSSLAQRPPQVPSNKPLAKGWPKEGHIGLPAYRSAKTGLNMMTLELGRMTKEDGVKIATVSPGFLASGLGGVGSELLKKSGAVPVEDGAQVVRGTIEGERDADAERGVVLKEGNQPW